jgi:hypothetical protein
MRSKMIKKLATAVVGAAVLGGGMVAVQNVTHAEDNVEYRFVQEMGIRSGQDLCLDGNMETDVQDQWTSYHAFLFNCKKSSPFERWRQVGQGPDGVELRIMINNADLCLDSPGPRGYRRAPVYVLPCMGGDNQKWNIKQAPATGNPRAADMRVLQNAQTQECLVAVTWSESGVFGKSCDLNNPEQWFVQRKV